MTDCAEVGVVSVSSRIKVPAIKMIKTALTPYWFAMSVVITAA